MFKNLFRPMSITQMAKRELEAVERELFAQRGMQESVQSHISMLERRKVRLAEMLSATEGRKEPTRHENTAR